MESDDSHFACPTCGKQFRWKPEIAGRTAKCGCGGKLVVPTEPPRVAAPASVPLSPDPLPPKPTAPVAACPSCKAPLPSGAVLCVNCGYNLKTGQKLSIVVEVEEDDADDDSSGGENDAPTAPAKDVPSTG